MQMPQSYLFVFMCLMLAPLDAHAATVAEESELKAAFVYNFTLFTYWPKTVPALRMCILGDINYANDIKTYHGRNINGTELTVERVLSAKEGIGCQVLLIHAKDQAEINSINQELNGAPVLTVMESGNFTPDSAKILLVKNNERMSFEINQTAATAAGLRFSYKLLKLARKVY